MWQCWARQAVSVVETQPQLLSGACVLLTYSVVSLTRSADVRVCVAGLLSNAMLQPARSCSGWHRASAAASCC